MRKLLASFILLAVLLFVMASPRGPLQSGAQVGEHLVTRVNTQLGFDRCDTMPVSSMQTWWDTSPYHTVGTYIGGENVGQCFFPDANWVREIESQGWGIVFIYVGLQAPCANVDFTNDVSLNLTTAEQQGRAAAVNASDALVARGASLFSTVYLDIENYDIDNVACRDAVNAFVKGWEQELDVNWTRSGLYGNSFSVIQGLVQGKCWEVDGCPDNVWMALWGTGASVWDDPFVANNFWKYHQRMRQYAGDLPESHGGVSWDIDRNCNLGEVAGGEDAHATGGHDAQIHQACE